MSHKSGKTVKTKKDLKQSRAVSKKHCSCLSKIKCYVSCILLVYLLYHVFYKCPEQRSLQLYDDQDFICKSSNKLYSYVSPVFGPVADKVSSHYHDSRLQGYVETADQFVSSNYRIYIKPAVEKYGPVIKEKSYDLYKFTLEKAFAFWILSRDITIKVGTFVIEKSTAIYNCTRDFWVNTGYPKVSAFVNYVTSKILYLLQKIGVKIYVEYNVYVAPKLNQLVAAIPDTFVGKIFIKIKQSAVVGFIASFFLFINEKLSWIYEKLSDVFVEFNKKENIFKSSDHYKFLEKKCEFLRSELGNKFFSPGFKIPSYKDLKIFQNMKSDSVSRVNEISALSSAISTVATTITATVTSLSKSTSSNQLTLVNTAIDSSYSSSLSISSDLSDALIQPSETGIATAIATSEKYEKLSSSVIKEAEEDAHSQLDDLVSNYSQIIRKSVKADMQSLSQIVTSGHPEIYEQLHSINKYAKGEKGYVSRQDYRDVLAKAASQIQEHADNILAILKKTEESYSNDSLEIKNSVLETLAEFSESTLTVYSNEIVKKDDDWKEWKKYNDMKKNLFKARNSISNMKPDGEQKLFDDVTKTVSILLNEGQSYMAIMRAKGNIEFQDREHKERMAQEIESKKASSDVVINGDSKITNMTSSQEDIISSKDATPLSSTTRKVESSPNVEDGEEYENRKITVTKYKVISAKTAHTSGDVKSLQHSTASLKSSTESKADLTVATAVNASFSTHKALNDSTLVKKNKIIASEITKKVENVDGEDKSEADEEDSKITVNI